MAKPLTDHYESNLKLLEKNHPIVWKQLLEVSPTPLGTIFYTPGGTPNLTVPDKKGKLITLHHETNPEKDSMDFLGKIPENFKGFVAILGMGLGYGVLEILKKRPLLQYLAIFERDLGIFLQSVKNMDLSPMLKDPRLILCIGQELNINKIISPASRTVQLEDAHILKHSPSVKFDPDGYKQLGIDLYAHINSLNVGGTTTRALGKDFLNNRFKHLCTIQHHFLLEQLQNKFSNSPAILVAGGPSLDKNVHLLKQTQEKAVIFAVDTVLPTLLENDVCPHFLTSIDPKNLTYEKFADIIPKVENIALICSSWVNLRTAKTFPAEKIFWTFTAKHLEAWINSLLGGKVLTGGAGTVAHLNLIAAHMLGCDPIIFIGQDLAYPATPTTHAKGTILYGATPTGIINGNNMGQTVKGTDGSLLRTDRAFLSMKSYFESAIAKSPQTHINATEGGAHIEGTQIMTLQEVLDRYCINDINPGRRIKEYSSYKGPIDTSKMLTAFQNIVNRISKLQQIIEKADKIVHSLYKELTQRKIPKPISSFSNLSQYQQKQIQKIDRFHRELDNAVEIWKILEEVTMEGLKESERKRQEIATLQNNPSKYTQWLTENLKRLLEINKVRKECLTLLETNLNMIISFNQRERQYQECIKTGIDKEQNFLNLAELYINSENYALAAPLVKELSHKMPESGQVNFYLGCLSEQFNDYEKAKQYYNKALTIRPDLAEKINSFQNNLGNEFLGFFNYFNAIPGRKASAQHMLLKGLKHCSSHEELIKEFQIMIKEDLKTIKGYINSKNYAEADALIKQWNEKVITHHHTFPNIPPELMSELLLYNGQIFLKEKKYTNALINFKNAIELSPLNHELHFFLIDTYFTTKNYDKAIQAINHAITIDKKFANYWEVIGDRLQADGQYEDAVSAYERCFVYLPENINLLKKIGECYIITGQLEAAKTAFEQLKLKLNSK